MDLFSLVAKLTLDAKEYEKAIKDAERSAKGARIDVEGTVSMQDNFTPALQGLKSEGANLDVEGTASLDTETYTTAAQTAGTTAAESLDAEGHADLDDTNYQEDATTASTNADDKLNVEGDATLDTTDYADTASTAATNLGDTLDATGDATLDTSLYGQDASDAAATASGNLDATGTASLDDTTYQTDATDAASDAGDALDLVGDASLDTTQYDTDVSNAESNATSDLSITATATLDTSGYDTSIENATSKANGLDGILKGLKVGAIVGGVSAVASWVGGALDDTAKYADEVDKASKRFGISMESYQEWAHALSQSGASTQDLQRGLLNITKARNGEEGSETVKAAFEKLGISEYLTPGKHTKEEAMNEVLMRLASLGPGDVRDNLVVDIFGRNGLQLNALLDSGVDGVKGLIKEAHDLGLIMSDEDVQKGVEYGDAMANMNDAMQAVKMDVAGKIIPYLIDLVNMATRIFASMTDDKGIQPWIDEYGAWEGFKMWVKYGSQSAEWVKNFHQQQIIAEQGGVKGLQAAIREENAAKQAEALKIDPSEFKDVQSLINKLTELGYTVETKFTEGTFNEKGDLVTPMEITNGDTVITVNLSSADSIEDTIAKILSAIHINTNPAELYKDPNQHAKGLWEVPYDNYFASLHRDEMVLTASQARDYKERDHGDSDVVEAIRGLRQDMTNLQIVVGQKTFGRTVVSYGGKRLGGYLGGAEDRLAAGYGWG